MTDKIGIVDLFSGPGGLGEGFAAAGRELGDVVRIALSVENDLHAFETMRLRAFLRGHGEDFPTGYHKALNDGKPLPDWSTMHLRRWKRACSETMRATLGGEGTFERIAPLLDGERSRRHGLTVLIGGPPCQAYSLVGRARNRGNVGYVPEDDGRHFLYREYVGILERLRPAAFVMENVKGMLSSKVGADGIFSRVLDDLEGTGDGYRLLALTTAARDRPRPLPKDFVVRAEEHGIPQARHRVFIIGFRNDIRIPEDRVLLTTGSGGSRSVLSVIEDLPRLRSGLSRDDSHEAWRREVLAMAELVTGSEDVPEEVADATELLLENGLGHHRDRTAVVRAGNDWPSADDDLAQWMHDPDLILVLHHETRGHIPGDVGRYLYAATFGLCFDRSPKLAEFPATLQPAHRNRRTGVFADRFRVQIGDRPSSTVTSHISKDGHYYIHPDPMQARSLTVREAARLQTFPDNYLFCGPRTEQYRQVGNAVPPFLAKQIGAAVLSVLMGS